MVDCLFWGVVVMRLLLFVFLVLLLGTSVFGVNVSPNSTFVFNYTNEFNVSLNQSFFCPFVEINVSDNVYDVTTSLSPGSSVVFSGSDFGGVCQGSFTCESSSASTGLCSIDATLRPGRDYVFDEGACDVRLEVDECVDRDVGLVTIDVPVEVERKRDLLFLQVGDDERQYPVPEVDFFYQFDMQFECPERIEVQQINDTGAVIAACRQLLPLVLDKQQATISACNDAQLRYVDRIETLSNGVDDRSGDLINCKDDLAALSLREGLLRNETASLRSLLALQSADTGVWKGTAQFFIFLTLLLSGVLGYVYWSDGGF